MIFKLRCQFGIAMQTKILTEMAAYFQQGRHNRVHSVLTTNQARLTAKTQPFRSGDFKETQA